SPEFGTIASQDHRRPMELADDTTCHDADHAQMPVAMSLHDREVRFRIKTGADGRDDLLGDLSFKCLPFSIPRVQRSREYFSLRRVRGEQQVQRRLRRLETAGCVQAGSELKANLRAAN